MKRSTQLAELKTQVKHNTLLHKVTARGGKGSKVVANQTKQSLRITWAKTTHCSGRDCHDTTKTGLHPLKDTHPHD